jgi:bacterioferritin (cytochrome b1)
MSDHIPDPTKMISDTPRTDAAEYESQDEPVAKLGSVDVDLARQLERELNVANERIKRLEREIELFREHVDYGDVCLVEAILKGEEIGRKEKEAKP